MKSYSLDSSIRKEVICILLVISFLLQVPMNWLLEKCYPLVLSQTPCFEAIFSQLSIIGVEISHISVLGIFGLLYVTFVKHLWKCKIIRRMTGVPNLEGVWTGILKTSAINPTTGEAYDPINMHVEITQDWNSIRIICHFKDSDSYSKTASIQLHHPKGCVLGFSYSNESKDIMLKTREYSGYNELVYSGNYLSGFYFTNREDGTHGIINLKREPNEKNYLY